MLLIIPPFEEGVLASGEFEEEMWEVLQETDGAERVDYIVIEMSGAAADPSAVVQSLERRHGKMTRARLEGVVLVVDADLLAHLKRERTREERQSGGGIRARLRWWARAWLRWWGKAALRAGGFAHLALHTTSRLRIWMTRLIKSRR